MAMDYLPIQASAVPCEHVFSSSAETDTKHQNHISPLLMESLQMLKFNLKKDRLDFMAGWTMQEKQMTDNDPEDDPLHTFLESDLQDGLDLILQSISKDED